MQNAWHMAALTGSHLPPATTLGRLRLDYTGSGTRGITKRAVVKATSQGQNRHNPTVLASVLQQARRITMSLGKMNNAMTTAAPNQFFDATERHRAFIRLAYRLWDRAGRPPGPYARFWTEAERQVMAGANPQVRGEHSTFSEANSGSRDGFGA
jgi:hypothetical protein